MLDVARFPHSFRSRPTVRPPVTQIRPGSTQKVENAIGWGRVCCLCFSTPLMGSPGTGTASGYKEMARCMLPAVARRVPVQHALWVAVDAGRCKLLQATASPPLGCSGKLTPDPAQQDNKQRIRGGMDARGYCGVSAYTALSQVERVLGVALTVEAARCWSLSGSYGSRSRIASQHELSPDF